MGYLTVFVGSNKNKSLCFLVEPSGEHDRATTHDLPPHSVHEKDAKVEIQRLDGNYYHFCWARSYSGEEILHNPHCVIELCEGIISVLNQMYNKV